LIPEPSKVPDPPPPTDPNAKEWFWAEGVKGEGAPPQWFKADRYKTVDEQAKAYPELEKRMGAFVGAPKDGKYEFQAPDGVEFDTAHPLAAAFTDWAGENQLNQKGYNELLGMLAQYEMAQIPDMAEIKKSMGYNADARINSIAQWGKANLPVSQYQMLRSATSGQNAGEVLQLVEALISKSQAPALPGPGSDTPSGQVLEEEAIREAQGKKNEKGQLLYQTDSEYRQKIEKMWVDFYKRKQPPG